MKQEATRAGDVEAELARAREQQAAVADVMRTMSAAPTDLDATLDAILAAATRLCHATQGLVYVLDGDVYRVIRTVGLDPDIDAWELANPVPVGDRGKATSRAALLGQPLHLPDVLKDKEYTFKEAQQRGKFRTILCVPLMKDGVAVAVISMWRTVQKPFSDEEIALVSTFADQALIAFENVRLASQTRESLEQQTAISDVLAAIGRATSDVRPVFQTILEHAGRLCDAERATIALREGDAVIVKAGWNIPQAAMDDFAREPFAIDRTSAVGRVLVEGRTLMWDDITLDDELSARAQTTRSITESRSVLTVPLLHDGVAIGAINLRRMEVRPFTREQRVLVETFAEQATLAIENVRLFNETKESLEQKTASARVLQAISEAREDVRPVLEAIVASAIRLCDGDHAGFFMRDGDAAVLQVALGEWHGAKLGERISVSNAASGFMGAAFRESRTQHTADAAADSRFGRGDAWSRSRLAVPVLVAGDMRGVIRVGRSEPGGFSRRQIELVESFAQQAAIAIENVRLFNETKESLEQQTATADLLKVVSRATSELQPVFDTIVESAVRVCHADYATFWRPDGDAFVVVAGKSVDPSFLDFLRTTRVTPERGSVTGRALLERSVVHLPDVFADPEIAYRDRPRPGSARSALGIPILRGGEVIALLAAGRHEVRPFSGSEITIAQAFADQAAIAIENVRLFNETNASLARQTASAEILQVISASPTDITPVFEAIAKRAAQYCDAANASVALVDGETFHIVGNTGDVAFDAKPRPLSGTYLTARAIRERRTLHTADLQSASEYPEGAEVARRAGYRAIAVAPMVRGDRAVGAVTLRRATTQPFSERQIELLETFAAQAAIAVENVRLFNETKEALTQQTAVAEVLKTISRSAYDLDRVLETVIENAARLADADVAWIGRWDGGLFRAGARYGRTPELRELIERVAPVPLGATLLDVEGPTMIGVSLRERRTIVEDDFLAGSLKGPMSEAVGARSIVAVPMLGPGEPIGVVVAARREIRPFTAREIELLETFADQAAIAVENVRLFSETTEALERQTAISEILRAMAASPTDERPVLDAIARSAVRFCGAEDAAVSLRGESTYRFVAHEGDLLPDFGTDRPLDESTVSGRAIVRGELVSVTDIQELAREFPRSVEFAQKSGQRAMVSAPMMRNGRAIGAIVLRRREARGFTVNEVDLLRAFADQAVIAIENVRLFNETQEALEQQRAISDILRVISESPTDIQPVLDAIARSATRYCAAEDCGVALLRADGMLEQVAQYGPISRALPLWPLDRGSVRGRAVVDRRVVHVVDMLAESDGEYAIGKQRARELGQRTILAAPLLREGVALGAIALRRTEVKPFSEKQIALLRTFADQAAIAIENVRLFNETKAALERQTATSEVLRAISDSAFDLQPMFDQMLRTAAQICRADYGFLYQTWDVRNPVATTEVVSSFNIPEDWAEENRDVIRLGQEEIRGRGLASFAESTQGRGLMAVRVFMSGATVHVPDIAADPDFAASPTYQRMSVRALLGVPMHRGADFRGVISLTKKAPGPFDESAIKLVETFADQAMIAIENVRLFNETKESLEQQAAVSEVLATINRSAFDLGPVLATVVEHAMRLSSADVAWMARIEGNRFHQVAIAGSDEDRRVMRERWEAVPEGFDLTERSVMGLTIAAGGTYQLEDLHSDPEILARSGTAAVTGCRTVIGVPITRDGKPFGAMIVGRKRVEAFNRREIELVETFAQQATIAIENVRLFNETKEALERQTAISEILRAITSSPTDVLPVFDAVAESAIRFCGAQDAVVMLPHGQELHVAAHRGTVPVPADLVYPLDGTSGNAVAFMEARVVHMPDLEDPATVERFPRGTATGHRFGFRAAVVAPLLREGKAIGCITLRRFEAGPFSGHQIDLLRTFADQAAIAIENVRLFNETKEALEQQTAIADILRVISASPSDTQPVLDAIAASATKFAAAEDASVLLVRDGALIPVAHHGPIPMPLSVSVDRDSVSGRAVIEARTVHAADVTADDEFPNSKRAGLQDGQRTVLAAPLIRDGIALGVIVMRRREPRPFTEQQLRLAQTFADQAAIAIENVRLFNETKESLERQTATGEILRVISASPTDIQPVLDAIVTNAVRYCGGEDSALHLIHDGRITGWAHAGPLDESERDAKIMQLPLAERTMIVRRDRAQGRAILDRVTIHMPDVQDPATIAEFPDGLGQGRAAKLPFRAAVVAPLRRQDEVIGTIMLRRTAPGPFTREQIALVETFAAQAVIAIENVRLFNETKESLERQTATSEVLKVISRSAQDLQPVFQAILESATRLSGTTRGGIYIREGDELRSVVHIGLPPGRAEYFDTHPTAKITMDNVVGRALLTREAVQVADASNDPSPEDPDDPTPLAIRPRTVLAIPMVQEGEAIGVIALTRGEVRPFSPNDVSLVTTFADQAVIAIANVRLFNETKEALERQTATTEILQVISSSPTAIQPVFDAIARSAARYCAAENATVFLVEGDSFRPVAKAGDLPLDPVARPLSGGYLQARVIKERLALRVTDIQSSAEYPDGAETGKRHGFHAIAVAPMIRGDRAIGTVSLRRVAAEPFSDRQFELLQTFAAQAAIAVENVRLFNETKEALERQTAVSEVLRVISRSAFDLKPVLDTVVETAARLCDADLAWIRSVEDGAFARQGAWYARSGQPDEQFPTVGTGDRPNPGSVVGRTLATRKPLQFADVAADRELLAASRFARETRSHSLLSVPLLREDEVVGVIVVSRLDVRPFSERQLQLLQTFADQAAIAIQNVRLFEETRAALERQTAISDVLKTISRSVFDLVPTLQAVIDNAARLAEADVAWLSERSAPAGSAADHVGREFDIAAMTFVRYGRTPELLALFGRTGTTPQRVGAVPQRSIMARIYAEGKTVHVHDMLLEPELAQASPTVKQTGARTVLAVPVVSEGKVIAGLIVARLAVRPFDAREIQLVETFADQAGIAIQNVRLFSDVQQKSRELEVANRHKSEFLANMSHELRTPLNAIIGFSEVMLQGIFGALNDKQREYQEDVLSSGKHLLLLINDILDLSKIEAGRMELEISTFSLANALDSGLTIVRERAGRHGITLQAVLPAGLPVIEADERKVKQILFNLLSNAVKFTPDGGRVEVRARVEDGNVRVDVQDTGIGIAPEDHARVFEEFQQVGRERSREGTGLGLTLSRRFVELQGGRIWLESTPGKGSTFSFTLPLRRPAEVKG